jgi:hypothetical protein
MDRKPFQLNWNDASKVRDYFKLELLAKQFCVNHINSDQRYLQLLGMNMNMNYYALIRIFGSSGKQTLCRHLEPF